jgi:hypothetical protein
MRLPSHETGFDLANSLHPARYRDNAAVHHDHCVTELNNGVEIDLTFGRPMTVADINIDNDGDVLRSVADQLALAESPDDWMQDATTQQDNAPDR